MFPVIPGHLFVFIPALLSPCNESSSKIKQGLKVNLIPHRHGFAWGVCCFPALPIPFSREHHFLRVGSPQPRAALALVFVINKIKIKPGWGFARQQTPAGVTSSPVTVTRGWHREAGMSQQEWDFHSAGV